MVATTGMVRSTTRRMLTGRALLEHVWALMGLPCGKYLAVMLPLWAPLLQQAGDLNKPFATESALAELASMSATTIDRYLAPARERRRGISTTRAAGIAQRDRRA